jgi:hypothetical protein
VTASTPDAGNAATLEQFEPDCEYEEPAILDNESVAFNSSLGGKDIRVESD